MEKQKEKFETENEIQRICYKPYDEQGKIYMELIQQLLVSAANEKIPGSKRTIPNVRALRLTYIFLKALINETPKKDNINQGNKRGLNLNNKLC